MSDREPIEGERTVSVASAGHRPWLTRRQIVIVVILGGVLFILFVFWRVPNGTKRDGIAQAAPRIGHIVPYQPPPPEPMPAPVIPVAARNPPLPELQPFKQTVQEATSTKEKRPAIVSYSVPQLPKTAGHEGNEGEAGQPIGSKATSVVYKGAQIVGAKAGPMPSRSLTLMPGPVRCTLNTAINSDLAGPFSCHLPQPALSPSGVKVMDRETSVIGNYASGVSQGQKRLMTITATAYTPNGCVVPLGGPMADELGRTGLAGTVDNHILERFGGAVLLSLIDSSFSLAQAELSKAGTTNLNINSGGVSSLASEVLRNTINIPPTIDVVQGKDVAFWTTTPISFDDCYSLEVK